MRTGAPSMSATGPAMLNYQNQPHGHRGAARSHQRKSKFQLTWLDLARNLVIGYSTAGRTFAYIGVCQLKIFLGEFVLGLFLWKRHRAVDWFFVRSRRSRYVEAL